ncbi:MAG TPA: right-handed parallel beta-helix repeat-containing protein [Candidatus Pullichristensenella stercorigallinarum]|uniref:Right-handed parallel beta-helix repeat-containing protein n=1 Tax=Candidatus Pullichristensenella stercorigallinarum TaxID=2840909 RepID=A0A9D1CX79_9FIRM|nr:right-handed parallel beta-helix repeat-containing protein [Candidatus Pullichristensenella stercorigallinarum]
MARRFMALLLAALLVLTAMAGIAEETSVSGTTAIGQVTQIDGSQITMRLGKLAEAASGGGGQPPEMPGDQAPTDGQPPEMPESEAPADGEAPGSEAPADGEAPGGAGQQPPMGGTPGFIAGEETLTFTITDATAIAVESASGTSDGSLADLAVDAIVRVVFGENETVASVTVLNLQAAMDVPGGFDGDAEPDNGDAATTIAEDGSYTGGTYTSTGDDENALRIDGATVRLDGVIIDKSGGASSSTEGGDFYGANAGLLALNGAQATLENITVFTSAQNGNGVFSYGQGTQVTIRNSAITTLNDNSGGLQTAGGGATLAENCTVETSGNSSAAIRSDRGGGTVDVDGGTYTTNGAGSPAVYSTAEISVANATLTANNSEAIVVEGRNSVELTDCAVSGNMTGAYMGDGSENIHNVMLYQSTSGDAAVGLSSFTMTGGSLTANAGDMFYITNTEAEITLTGVSLTNAADGALLRVEGNSASRGWGAAGQNGAQAVFNANSQLLAGDVIVDSISTLDFNLSGGSTFNGTIKIVENAQGGTAVDGNANVVIGEGCTWSLTGDCTVSTLENNGEIIFNGFTITLADGTVVSD